MLTKTFILYVVLYSSWQKHVATDHVYGFKNKDECVAAGELLKTMKYVNSSIDVIVYYTCMEQNK